MNGSIWHRESCNPGREYQLARNIHIKYDDRDTIISRIIDQIKGYLKIETAVRLTIDTPLCAPEKAIIAIPFDNAENDRLLANFATTIYQSMMGYYISAEPKTTHFGIANLIIEGKVNSLIRREMEKLFYQYQNRDDLAGRLLRNVSVKSDNLEAPGDNYLFDTIHQGMDIHVGYRVLAFGESINDASMFIPLREGKEIIDRVYYNMEQMIHHNFVSYDESGDGYLKVTDTLVFKELSSILKRCRIKQNTRKKLLNNLKFTTVFTEDPALLYGAEIGDSLYDTINNVFESELQTASQRSREMLSTCMIRATEITNLGIDISKLTLGSGKTYVPSRPTSPETSNIGVNLKKRTPVVKSKGEKESIKDRLTLRRDAFQEL